MAETTPRLGLPYAAFADPARIEETLNPILDRLDAVAAALDDARFGGVVPIGGWIGYGGNSDPPETNFLLADGRFLKRDDYPDLWVRYGVAFGSTDSTNFAIPDLRGRVVVGPDNMGTPQGAAGRLGASNSLGRTGGEELHRLTTAEMPSHGHGVTDPGHNHGGATGGGQANRPYPAFGHTLTNAFQVYQSLVGYTAIDDWGGQENGTHTHPIAAGGTGISVQAVGGGGTHNNMPPYLVSNFIVRVR